MKNRIYLAVLLAAFSGVRALDAQKPVDDPLTVFSKMMPVLSHDRCVNCHGATDPYKGFFHPGSVPLTSTCIGCHTASPQWRLAPGPTAFFQKNTRQLCDHFSRNLEVGEGTANHLATDALIGLAFAGRRGNAVPGQYTQKPPMTRAEFVRAYRDWVRLTGGGCSSWEGTITRTETNTGDTTGMNLPDVKRIGPITVTSWQKGTHTITVKIKGGAATASATLSGEINNKEITKAPNCELTAHMRDAYSLVSTKGAAANPAPGDTMPLAAIGDAIVRVGLAADGSYKIHVIPPAERTQKTSTTKISSTCPIPNAAPPAHTDTFDWHTWVFEVAAKLPNPRLRTQLQGSTVDTLTYLAKPPFGLAFMGAAVGRSNETNVKFLVTTTWNLKRAP
jgi:hypothetical protein